MNVPFSVLKQMVEESFTAGRESCWEVGDQCVEEILCKYKIRQAEECRVYLVSELRSCSIGSIFYHPLLGRGEIVTKKGIRAPFMKFESGLSHAFAADVFPWNMPITRIEEK